MSTVKVNAITDASGGNTATINSMTPTADSLQGFRNRIINGAMMIDQRNAGASVTPADGGYVTDRWKYTLTQASKLTAQQSTTAPSGFKNSLLTTSSSAYSIVSSDIFVLIQNIEGFNAADLGWGTVSAKSVTLSFQVRSSLTGTFGGSIENSARDRSYPFTYTINAANTWESKSVTITGDTSGTWLTDNGVGIRLHFGLGVGSTYSGTAGSWAAADYRSATGATSVVGTNGATWYITGVQLEVGSVATPFERRDYGRELMLCQRYFQIFKGDGDFISRVSVGQAWSSTNTANHNVPFIVTMRGAPTLTQSGLQLYSPNVGSKSATIVLGASANENGTTLTTNSSTGLTAGNMWYIAGTNTSSYAAFSSEL